MPWSGQDRSEFTWQPTTTKWNFTLSPKANEFVHLAVDCKFQISWPIRLMQWLGEVLCCLVRLAVVVDEEHSAEQGEQKPSSCSPNNQLDEFPLISGTIFIDSVECRGNRADLLKTSQELLVN